MLEPPVVTLTHDIAQEGGSEGVTLYHSLEPYMYTGRQASSRGRSSRVTTAVDPGTTAPRALGAQQWRGARSYASAHSAGVGLCLELPPPQEG